MSESHAGRQIKMLKVDRLFSIFRKFFETRTITKENCSIIESGRNSFFILSGPIKMPKTDTIVDISRQFFQFTTISKDECFQFA